MLASQFNQRELRVQSEAVEAAAPELIAWFLARMGKVVSAIQ